MAGSEEAGWEADLAAAATAAARAEGAERSVMAVAARAAGLGLLVLVVKVEEARAPGGRVRAVEEARAPGERVRAVAAVTGLVGVVTAVLVRAVGVARAQVRGAAAVTRVSCRCTSPSNRTIRYHTGRGTDSRRSPCSPAGNHKSSWMS